MSLLNFNGLLRTVADDFRDQWAKFNPLAIWISSVTALGGFFSTVNWGDLVALWTNHKPVPLVQGYQLLDLIEFRYVVYAFIFSVVAGVLLRPLFSRVITLMVGQNLSLLSFVYVLLALRGLFSFKPIFQVLYVALVLMFVLAIAIEAGGGLFEMRRADHNFGAGSMVVAVLLDLLFLSFCIVPLLWPLTRAEPVAPAPSPSPVVSPTPSSSPTPFHFTDQQIHFASDNPTLDSGEVVKLQTVAGELKAHPSVRIYVDGYCDEQASDDYNLQLSQARAQAVAVALQDDGIARSRLLVRWFGKRNFVATNQSERGRAANRRVELMMIE